MVPYDRTPIESFSIQSVQFKQNEKDFRGDLTVEFRSGKMYKYTDVPAKFAEDLVHASSPGTYFKDKIAGQFNLEKV